jgi:signal transduction histidine kinase
VRLGSKIFLTCSLVIVVLAGVGGASLRAIARLVSVNREITTETMPALRLTASLRDAIPVLARQEARLAVLRDARYAAAWREAAARTSEDLARVRQFVKTAEEQARLTEAILHFERYRKVVEAEHVRLLRDRTRPAPAQSAGRALGEVVEEHLDGLLNATYSRVISAQAEARRLEARTWTGVVIALAAAVSLALVGTWLIAFRMTRSLRRLSKATAAVAAGSFREPIPVDATDEIGALARSFNSMALQLRQLDETKEEFFASLSHELRSPLTSVREASHLLREEVSGPLTGQQARLVEIIGQSSDRLLRLVNQMLEMSRLRAGILPLQRSRLDVDGIVARAVEELRPQAQDGGVHVERERLGADWSFMGDDDRLTQVVVNLLANAIRFTPRGGRVVVRVVDAGPEIEIQVEDTGIGIPAAALPHIFESYRQAHRDRGGTGLGLSVVRGVVQAHGGRVTVESQEGKGSRFTVLLPRRVEAR